MGALLEVYSPLPGVLDIYADISQEYIKQYDEDENHQLIDAEDLNYERIDCLITSFCKPYCNKNPKEDQHSTYQYDLIHDYLYNPNEITPYTFLSYEQYKTNSVLIDPFCKLYASKASTWPDHFVQNVLIKTEKARKLLIRCVTLELLVIICMIMMALFRSLWWIPFLLNLVTSFYMFLSVANYWRMTKLRHYLIHFNINTESIEHWELRPMKMKKYGSLHLINHDMYACQVIRMEQICGFKELIGFALDSDMINGTLKFKYGDNKRYSLKLQGVAEVSRIDFKDILTEFQLTMAKIQSGWYHDVFNRR